MVTVKTSVVKDSFIKYLDKISKKFKHTDATVGKSVQTAVNSAQGKTPVSEAQSSLRSALGKTGDSKKVKAVSTALQSGVTDIIRNT